LNEGHASAFFNAKIAKDEEGRKIWFLDVFSG
jgi:hypothetical protein